MKVALASIDQKWENKPENSDICQKYIRMASEFHAQIILFPEMTLTGFSMNIHEIGEDAEDSPTVKFFRELASRYKIAIFFGVVFLKDLKATNNLISVDSSGNILSTYSKIHPFSFSGEDKYYTGGQKLSYSDMNGYTIGSTVCYDLRFPEIFQCLSERSQVIVNIANWPERRISHWKVLLQARAIENQSFIIGVNRTGTDGKGINYVKSSIIFDPWGEKLSVTESWENLDCFDIQPEAVSSVRSSFPVKHDRQKDLYKSLM